MGSSPTPGTAGDEGLCGILAAPTSPAATIDVTYIWHDRENVLPREPVMSPHDDLDLDEITRELFADRNPVREWLDARAAAAAAPPPEPSIIPMPEFPGRRSGFVTRTVAVYRCTAPGSCPWAFAVNTALESTEPLILPATYTSEDLDRALTERAEQRLTDLRTRIETEIRDHFTEAHPGQEPPDQVERLRQEEAERRRRLEAASR